MSHESELIGAKWGDAFKWGKIELKDPRQVEVFLITPSPPPLKLAGCR